jgi:hypothetical protein
VDSDDNSRPEVKNEHEENWLASLRVLRTESASEIRCFQEVFREAGVGELMLKVASLYFVKCEKEKVH